MLGGSNMETGNPMYMRLAQAQVPFQFYTNRWEPMKALMMGTVFPELYRVYQSRK
ncbi:MAG TPA: spore coat associated protein CotJA [Firmicutes bacterium]|jgi:hypothetical protein|nr:spore coat associated protein CotJA [Bacillota bacterium]